MLNQQKIYDNSPIFIQNLLATIKGWQLTKERKRGNYVRYLTEIEDRRHWSEDQLNNYALQELRRLLIYANESVPHYRQLFTKLNFDPTQCSSIEYFQKLPVLDRKQVKHSPQSFYSSDSRNHHVSLNTTGTTGSPLAIVADRDGRQKNYAFFDSFLHTVGIDAGEKHVVIGGRPIIPAMQHKPPFWRHSIAQNALLMSSYHITKESISGYISQLTAFKPAYIESYPSALYLLARTAQQEGIAFQNTELKGIITSAEKLHDYQRTLIEAFFKTSIFDQYGNAEMCCLIHQCSNGAYHLRSDYGLLELLDDQDKPVNKGEPGYMVCTGFVNYQMPLVRYRIGDSAILSADQCSCGLNTPIIQEILGREDDVLVGADGRVVGRMSPVLKGLPIFESQYVQHVVGEVIVKIIPDREFLGERDIPNIENLVKHRMGENTKVTVELVESLDYGRGQKLRNVISTIKTNG